VSPSSFDQAVWKVVLNIPCGQVMSYGEVARAAGYPRNARMVSKALSRCHESLPWHRVVRSDRRIAFRIGSDEYEQQKSRLLAEGVQVSAGKVSVNTNNSKTYLDRLLWRVDDD